MEILDIDNEYRLNIFFTIKNNESIKELENQFSVNEQYIEKYNNKINFENGDIVFLPKINTINFNEKPTEKVGEIDKNNNGHKEYIIKRNNIKLT